MSFAMNRHGRRLLRLAQVGVHGLALLFVLQLLVGFLGVPRAFSEWIAGAHEVLDGSPDVIVVLGGGGIPSETGLMRTYYGAFLARQYPEAQVIVALPADSDPEQASVGRMKRELIMRGVDADRIVMADKGNNTYQQAREIRRLLGDRPPEDPALLVVTSPTHMRRSLRCFRRVGFSRVGGCHAAEVFAEADMESGFSAADYLGGGLGLRYGFWSRLEYEVQVTRELLALLHYRLRGWN